MFRLFRHQPLKPGGKRPRARLLVEQLEPRLTLSLLLGDLGGSDARGGSSPPPAIRLDLVALHELGHSLGLEHDNTSAVSIMDPYYNANYNPDADFANDPAVAKLLTIYADVNTSGWNDVNDRDVGLSDGDVDLTYSFMAGGLRMDGGKPVYSTAIPSNPDLTLDWRSIITAQLDRWATVSAGKLTFTKVDDGAFAFNTTGSPQNDSRFGDIRIGSHYFDGAGKVLAHAYYPPPNGSTAAGDAHFDNSENWVSSDGITPLLRSSSSSANSSGGSAGSSSLRNIKGSDFTGLETVALLPQLWLTGSGVSPVVNASGTLSVTEVSPNAEPLFVSTAAFAPLANLALPRPLMTGSSPAADSQRIGVTTARVESVARLGRAQLHDLVMDQYAESVADSGPLTQD